MIKEIIDAFCGEMQALFADAPGTSVLRDTQFDGPQTPSHSLPLVILGLADSPDVKQLSGGCTQAEWNWEIRAYFIDSNAELSPDQAFSTGDYSIIETITNHFNFQNWLTADFRALFTTYSFKLTYQDTSKAAELIKDDGGIVPGFQILYNSIAIDTRTSFSVYSAETLQKVDQVPDGTLAISATPLMLSFIKAGEAKTTAITANTPWLVTSKPTWAAVSAYEGVAGATLTITAAANPTAIARTGTVVIEAPLTTLTDVNIALTQAGT